MAKRLTDEDKIHINEVYYLTKNFAETARRTGFSSASVRKYVDLDFTPKENINIIKFKEEDIPEQVDYVPFIKSENWGEFCILSDEEKDEIEELWKELAL